MTANELCTPDPAKKDPLGDSHTNFILLGHQRCGSNLILRALAEHPQIRMAGEILAPDPTARAIGWKEVNRIAWTEPRGEGYRVGEDGAEFLKQRVFGTGPAGNIRGYGFKLFFDHASFDQASSSAWDYLLSHDIKVVHLVRRNLLYALISHEVASRTKIWHRRIEDRGAAPPPLPPFALDANYCREYFDRIAGWRLAAAQAFASHSVLTIEYEKDLCADFQGTMFKVFEFLNLWRWYSRPGMIKQQQLTAPQQIANFDQLRIHFRDTPYSEFFEDAALPQSVVNTGL